MRGIALTLVLTVVAGAQNTAVSLPDALSGLRASGAQQEYSNATLFDYMDGGAETFTEAGLVRCYVRQYSGAPKRAVEIAVYAMDTRLAAFGLFRQLRGASACADSSASERLVEQRRTSFWKDAVYVEVLDKSSGPADTAGVIAVARALARALPGDASLPPEVYMLPDTGKVPGSERYTAKNFRGRATLRGVLSADYRCEDTTVCVFVMKPPTAKAAEEAREKLGASLGPVTTVAAHSQYMTPAFVHSDRFLAVVRDRVLLGILGIGDLTCRAAIAARTVARIAGPPAVNR
jgi:hypothetical protein